MDQENEMSTEMSAAMIETTATIYAHSPSSVWLRLYDPERPGRRVILTLPREPFLEHLPAPTSKRNGWEPVEMQVRVGPIEHDGHAYVAEVEVMS